MDLLNSGSSSLKGWRFTNDISSRKTIIVCVFDLYPVYGKSFSDLKLEFTHVNKTKLDKSNIQGTLIGDTPTTGGLKPYKQASLYNSNRIELPWDTYGFEQGEVYKVKLTYKDCSD